VANRERQRYRRPDEMRHRIFALRLERLDFGRLQAAEVVAVDDVGCDRIRAGPFDQASLKCRDDPREAGGVEDRRRGRCRLHDSGRHEEIVGKRIE
jgi:hypothetical protein